MKPFALEAAKHEANPREFALTKEDAELILRIRDGADVFGYSEARRLRDISNATGDKLIVVCKAQSNEHMRRPYFGVYATAKGAAMAARITGEQT